MMRKNYMSDAEESLMYHHMSPESCLIHGDYPLNSGRVSRNHLLFLITITYKYRK